MKNKTLIISFIVCFCFAFAKAQRGARVAYVDMEYILEGVPEYQDAVAQLEQKMQRWKNEIDGMSNEIKQMESALNNEKVLLTKELIEEKEEDIAIKQQELSEYQQKRFGAQGDFYLQRLQLIKPVQDQVFNEVQKVSKQRKYDYVVDASETTMLYAAERHDISDQVLRAIGATGRKKDREEKADDKNDGEEPYLNVVEAEEKEERLEEREKIKEAREQVFESRQAERAEQARVRDSVKEAKAAAYQQRREEMLKERNRRRDSIQAAREAARKARQEELEREREEARKKREEKTGGN